MLAGKADVERAEGNLAFVAVVEGKVEAEKNEAQLEQHFIPMKAVAAANQTLQRFNTHGRDEGKHDAAGEGVEMPER